MKKGEKMTRFDSRAEGETAAENSASSGLLAEKVPSRFPIISMDKLESKVAESATRSSKPVETQSVTNGNQRKVKVTQTPVLGAITLTKYTIRSGYEHKMEWWGSSRIEAIAGRICKMDFVWLDLVGDGRD
jgi:hypothetical protein